MKANLVNCLITFKNNVDLETFSVREQITFSLQFYATPVFVW